MCDKANQSASAFRHGTSRGQKEGINGDWAHCCPCSPRRSGLAGLQADWGNLWAAHPASPELSTAEIALRGSTGVGRAVCAPPMNMPPLMGLGLAVVPAHGFSAYPLIWLLLLRSCISKGMEAQAVRKLQGLLAQIGLGAGRAGLARHMRPEPHAAHGGSGSSPDTGGAVA